jgi:hypothetical protein
MCHVRDVELTRLITEIDAENHACQFCILYTISPSTLLVKVIHGRVRN